MNAVASEPENDLSSPHAWQPRPRVRWRSARVDVAVGVVLALLALLLAPGLGVVAVMAVAILALCALSALISRRRAGAPTALGFQPSAHADPTWR
jgi:hypothetical protein